MLFHLLAVGVQVLGDQGIPVKHGSPPADVLGVGVQPPILLVPLKAQPSAGGASFDLLHATLQQIERPQLGGVRASEVALQLVALVGADFLPVRPWLHVHVAGNWRCHHEDCFPCYKVIPGGNCLP